MPRAAKPFWDYVEKTDACWIWLGGTSRGQGVYGKWKGKQKKAHRLVYEMLVGPIPEGMTLDHLCHKPDECAGGESCPHRRCVNPAHLEPVSLKENVLRGGSVPARNARKIVCLRGHPLDGLQKRGRQCLTCRRLRKQGLLAS